MRKAALLLLVVLAACTARQPDVVVRPDSACAAQRDSLRARLDTVRAELRDQVVLIRLAELQSKRYAAIVARDPTQSRFLVGWINRAFTGVVP